MLGESLELLLYIDPIDARIEAPDQLTLAHGLQEEDTDPVDGTRPKFGR